MYVVLTPATGDMRRFVERDDEPAEAALVRAVGAAAPGDIVALIRRGSITCVWTARAEA
jgi:hypothetical protein